VTVLVDEIFEQPIEMVFIWHGDMIKQLAAQGSHGSLDEWNVPWTPVPGNHNPGTRRYAMFFSLSR
jgi:hypothetical protein